MTQRLAEQLQAFLIANGVGRRPTTAGSSLPPIWLDPKEGVPAPGDGGAPTAHADLVLALVPAPGVAPDHFEGWFDRPGIDIWLRARNPVIAEDAAWTIRGLLNDRRHFLVGGLLVEESLVSRPFQKLYSDENGWTYLMGFQFLVRESAYAA